MRKNVLLTLYGDGYAEFPNADKITEAGFRAEGFLDISDVTDPNSAGWVSLATLAAVQDREHSIRVVPEGAPWVPGIDFDIGDRVGITSPRTRADDSARTASLSLAEDGEGNPVFGFELASSFDTLVKRQNRWLKRVNHGGLDGHSSNTTPTYSSPSIKNTSPAPSVSWDSFGNGGPLVVGDESSPFAPPRPMRLPKVLVNATVAGAGTSQFRLYRSFRGTLKSLLVTVSIGPGAYQSEVCFSFAAAPVGIVGHQFTWVTFADGGHQGVSLQSLPVAIG